MKTTVDIPEKLLESALKYTGAKTKKDAIVHILEDYDHRMRVQKLFDSIKNGPPLDFPSNDEIEAGELDENADMDKLWSR
jgi:hypothetical protein